jgi:hypothetical protein
MWSNDRTDAGRHSRTRLRAHGNGVTRSSVTFRSDEDAARAREEQLVTELERERAQTAATLAELEVARAERQRLYAASCMSKENWQDGKAIDFLLIALLWLTALALLFAVLYVPRVLIEGRW